MAGQGNTVQLIRDGDDKLLHWQKLSLQQLLENGKMHGAISNILVCVAAIACQHAAMQEASFGVCSRSQVGVAISTPKA